MVMHDALRPFRRLKYGRHVLTSTLYGIETYNEYYFQIKTGGTVSVLVGTSRKIGGDVSKMFLNYKANNSTGTLMAARSVSCVFLRSPFGENRERGVCVRRESSTWYSGREEDNKYWGIGCYLVAVEFFFPTPFSFICSRETSQTSRDRGKVILFVYYCCM